VLTFFDEQIRVVNTDGTVRVSPPANALSDFLARINSTHRSLRRRPIRTGRSGMPN
jgi:hypothetical protein